MISKYEMAEYLEKNKDKFKFYYNKETDCLHNKEDNSIDMKMDVFMESYRKKNGESFECLYDEHVSLFSVIRCTECGTVIFEHSDEDYEHNLKCPTCTDYKTYFDYWTKEQIEQDEDKQKCIQFYINCTKWEEERYKREKQRNGKRDDQLLIFHKKTNKYKYDIELKCNDVTKSYIKGLMVKITRWKPCADLNFYTWDKDYRIPLGVTDLLFEIRLMKHRKESLKTL